MPATRIFLVRHGATVLSAEDRFAGATDVELSEEGRRQATRLGERLAAEKIAAVYASPMSRTRETASRITASHKLKIRTKDGLREIHHGRWEQMTRAEVEKKYPEEYQAWEADPFTFAPLGGESGIAVMARALPALREIVVAHKGEQVLVVSHKATIRLLISSLLGIDARGYRDRLDQNPCCLNILDFKDSVRARLMLYNDVSHYTGQPDQPKANLSKWWDAEKESRPVAVDVDSETLSDLERASRLEWLETNGKGGFASSSVIGANTRRYHSLLTAALSPPVRRHVLLSRVEEVIEPEGHAVELATNFYPGAVHPQGYKHLQGFRLDPFPIFTFWIGDRGLEKAVFLVDGEDTVVIRYTLFAGPGCFLQVRPFIAFRDYHSLTGKNDALDRRLEKKDGTVSVHPYGDLPTLHFHHDAREVIPNGDWWLNQLYPRESERGLESAEDLYSPFALRFELSTGSSAFVIASLDRAVPADPHALERAERGRRREVVGAARRKAEKLDETLALAADAYVVDRSGGGRTVIAGYPWFTDWGRDTMISLPGLCLATGRLADARDILTTFARSIDRGMIPNLFPDANQTPEYNNVDGTLWFVRACGQYVTASGDAATAKSVFLPALRDVVRHHREGTRFGIRVDSDGLLRAGEPGVQLTWMDAKVGDWVVTPRAGKPVEIQALWIAALETTAEIARSLGDAATERECLELARVAREAFARRFWYAEGGYLYDVVDPPEGHDDPTLRPNQIFAVALPKQPLLDEARSRSVLEVVERELLTPFGLRTLSPRDHRYVGRYFGDPRARDGAYHQGTVWPWLIGPFVTAYLRVHGRTATSVAKAQALIEPLVRYAGNEGVGQVAEVFDADPPHRPGGCIAQAWSVAELVRVLAELA